MALKEERMQAYLGILDALVGDGGEGNFAVFEEPRSGLFVQAAGSRGAETVLVDVPTGAQDVPDGAGDVLAGLGLERSEATWYDVDQDELERAGPEATAALHEWISGGRDPEDERLDRLEAWGLVERRTGHEVASYQAVLPPERAAYVVDRVLREALGAPGDHDARIEVHLEGRGSTYEHVGDVGDDDLDE